MIWFAFGCFCTGMALGAWLRSRRPSLVERSLRLTLRSIAESKPWCGDLESAQRVVHDFRGRAQRMLDWKP